MNQLNQLKEYSEFVKEHQDEQGRVVSNHLNVLHTLDKIIVLLNSISEHYKKINKLTIIIEDIENWIRKGIDLPPEFKKTAEHLADNHEELEHMLFVGPYRLANSGSHRGFRFEFFFANIGDPEFLGTFREKYPHPCDKTLSLRLIMGTEALYEGNNVVFFPESIHPKYKKSYQKFAIFFFDKFRNIYLSNTMPRVEKALRATNNLFASDSWSSKHLTKEDMYNARCLWGYIHDLFHFKGPRPFGEDIGLKTNWELGLLEEIKVDCQTALFMLKNDDITFSKEIIEFILFERLFRYPAEEDAENNFDAGTGVFLFNWLNKHLAIKILPAQSQFIADKLFQAMQKLVDTILELESLPDKQYKEQGHKLVYDNLQSSPGKKFSINKEYLEFAQ